MEFRAPIVAIAAVVVVAVAALGVPVRASHAAGRDAPREYTSLARSPGDGSCRNVIPLFLRDDEVYDDPQERIVANLRRENPLQPKPLPLLAEEGECTVGRRYCPEWSECRIDRRQVLPLHVFPFYKELPG